MKLKAPYNIKNRPGRKTPKAELLHGVGHRGAAADHSATTWRHGSRQARSQCINSLTKRFCFPWIELILFRKRFSKNDTRLLELMSINPQTICHTTLRMVYGACVGCQVSATTSLPVSNKNRVKKLRLLLL